MTSYPEITEEIVDNRRLIVLRSSDKTRCTRGVGPSGLGKETSHKGPGPVQIRQLACRGTVGMIVR